MKKRSNLLPWNPLINSVTHSKNVNSRHAGRKSTLKMPLKSGVNNLNARFGISSDTGNQFKLYYLLFQQSKAIFSVPIDFLFDVSLNFSNFSPRIESFKRKITGSFSILMKLKILFFTNMSVTNDVVFSK